jgi:acetyltransferase-like isoleucine patch superfamily enzyme
MQKLYRKKFASLGEKSEFRPGAYAITCSKIAIGARVVIRPQSMLFADPHPGAAGGRIIIEDDVLIGSGVHVYTGNHAFSDPNLLIAKQGHRIAQDVILRVGSWIGANVVILPGVEIGAGAVIGAGSIVSRSIAAGSIAVGNPARTIRNCFDAKP